MNINRFPGLSYKWIDVDDVAYENIFAHFPDAHAFIGASSPSLSPSLPLLIVLALVIHFVDEALAGKGACLVHCDAGVSRSPTIVQPSPPSTILNVAFQSFDWHFTY